MFSCDVFFLMIRRPPRSTRTDTLFPYTTLCRSAYFRLEARFKDSRDGLPIFLATGNRASLNLVDPQPIKQAGNLDLRFAVQDNRSEEHTSELQSLMRISYAVFCLKKKKNNKCTIINIHICNNTLPPNLQTN